MNMERTEREMDKIAVLIPCYNESATIEKVVTDYKDALTEKILSVLSTETGLADINSFKQGD